MHREPALTFGGALTILGHHERPLIRKLDKALGGAILAAGASAAVGTAAGVAAVPIGLLTSLWGWLDQKNEATALLSSTLDRVSDRLLRIGGYERHRLVAAAHTHNDRS